ncbi:MAG: prolyl oligopeptidase family serine peptidase [Planctomycetia bacterium]|nr:prolyl oligopeptidase family serine peptidase [Planctomycetia bacterium]
MRKFVILLMIFFLTGSFLLAKDPGEIWDLEKLKQPPQAKWGPVREKVVKDANGKDQAITTQKVWYQGELYRGKPTTIMAFYSRPKGNGPFPGLVLVHGGGGTAFSDWTEFWAARGYAAISIDHFGCEVDGEESSFSNRARHPLPDGIPSGTCPNLLKTDMKDTWPYHAVAAVMLAHSLLDAQKDVDPNRTGLTGASWGGYLTSLAAGIDDRFQTAVPVYGCGGLDVYSWQKPVFDRFGKEYTQLWKENCDPNTFLPRVKYPMLFVTGTDDFAFPLEINRSSWEKVPGADVWLGVHMPHSMPNCLSKEFVTWFDFILKSNKPPLPCLGPIAVQNENGKILVSASVKYHAKPVKAHLRYSTDKGGYPVDKNGKWGKWNNRNWKFCEAKIADGKVSAVLPDNVKERPVVFYLDAVDESGNVASSHFDRVEK